LTIQHLPHRIFSFVPNLLIHRPHQLGLSQARQIAARWAEDAQTKLDMECSLTTGDTSDTLAFSRTGVKGTLLIEADHFTLNATLGFLLGAFSKKIEAEIEKNLDELLAEKGGNLTGSAQKP
jgi:putative polyhydroxyalkanoate system protein